MADMASFMVEHKRTNMLVECRWDENTPAERERYLGVGRIDGGIAIIGDDAALTAFTDIPQ